MPGMLHKLQEIYKESEGENHVGVEKNYLIVSDDEINKILQGETINGHLLSIASYNEDYELSKSEGHVMLKIWNDNEDDSKTFLVKTSHESKITFDSETKPSFIRVLTDLSSILLIYTTIDDIRIIYFNDLFSKTLKLNHPSKGKKTFIYENGYLYTLDVIKSNVTITDYVNDVVKERWININPWANNLHVFTKLFAEELNSDLCLYSVPTLKIFDEDITREYKVYRHEEHILLVKNCRVHFLRKKNFELFYLKSIDLEMSLQTFKNEHFQLRSSTHLDMIVFLLFYCPSPVRWFIVCVDISKLFVRDIIEFKPKRNRPYLTLNLSKDKKQLLVQEKHSNITHRYNIFNTPHKLQTLCLNNLSQNSSINYQSVPNIKRHLEKLIYNPVLLKSF